MEKEIIRQKVTVGKNNKTLKISIPVAISLVTGIKEKDIIGWTVDNQQDTTIELQKINTADKQSNIITNNREKPAIEVTVGRQNQTLRISIPKTISMLYKIQKENQLEWIIKRNEEKIIIQLRKC